MSHEIEGPNGDARDSRRVLDRRTLIKGAAIAGAAAWTAPVIIDSLVSPAAASSAPGCYYYSYVWRLGTTASSTCGFSNDGANCQPTLSGATCSSTNWVNGTPPTISASSCSYNGTNSVDPGTWSISGSTCKFVGYAVNVSSASSCPGSKTITGLANVSSVNLSATGAVDRDYVRVFLVVQCS